MCIDQPCCSAPLCGLMHSPLIPVLILLCSLSLLRYRRDAAWHASVHGTGTFTDLLCVGSDRVLLQFMRDEGLEPDIYTYNSAMNVCGHHGRPEAAQLLLRHMLAGGLQPDVYSYSCVLDAYAKACRVDDALRVLQEMAKADVSPNVVAYTSVMEACLRAGGSCTLTMVRVFTHLQHVALDLCWPHARHDLA